MASPKAKPRAKPKSPATTQDAGDAVAGKRKTDWDAVERDYRTAQFTLRELEAKHGATYTTISRRATKLGWTQDLTKAIKQATNTALIESLVQHECTKAQQGATTAVLAAAEVNARVILGHRKDAAATRDVAAALLEELAAQAMLTEHQELLADILAGSGAEPKDEAQARMVVKRALDVGARIAGVKTLAEAFTKVQAMERVAFKLDSEPTPAPNQEDKENESEARFNSFSAKLDQIINRTGHAP